MVNKLKKIDIHYSTLLFLLLALLAGMFKNIIILFSIIIMHELGHLIASLIFKYKITKIHIYPYGGMIEYNEDINRPINEDFIIAISGVLLQSIYYFIIYFLYKNYIIRENVFIIFCNYHFSILLFNLLPIYPLDGIKIINLILNKLFPYKLSHILSIIISIILVIIFLIYNNSNNCILMGMLLLQKIYDEIKNHKYLFNKFLVERYLNNYRFKKYKYIKKYNLKNMYRDYNHVFFINNQYISEKKALNLRFKIDI